MSPSGPSNKNEQLLDNKCSSSVCSKIPKTINIEYEHCSECTNKKILCIPCSKYIHGDHLDDDDDRKHVGHTRIPLKLYLSITEFLNWKLDKNKLNEIIEAEKKNKLIYFDINDGKIVCGDKWLNHGYNESDLLSIMSIIGQSGCGKSTTIGNITGSKPLNHPFPGLTTDFNSNSSDLNAYTVNSLKNPNFKYLLIDSEGLGGDLKPNYHPTNLLKKFKYDELRNIVVQISYPRLLYLCSDVIVFTTASDPKAKQTLFNDIMLLAKVSSSSINLQSRPHLIILYNKLSFPQEYDDIGVAKSFLFGSSDDYFKSLEKFFQSISVITVPNVNETHNGPVLKRYYNQQVCLCDLIETKLMESRQFKIQNNIDISVKKTLSVMLRAICYFTIYPKAIPNMKYLSCTDPDVPIPHYGINAIIDASTKMVDSMINNLKLYFNSLHTHFKSKNYCKFESYTRALSSLKTRLIHTFIKLMKTNGIDRENINDLLKKSNNSLIELTSYVQKFIPCNSTDPLNPKVSCDNIQESHAMHQSESTYSLKVENKGIFDIIFRRPNKSIEVNYSWTGHYKKGCETTDFYSLLEAELTENYVDESFLNSPSSISFFDKDFDYNNVKGICFGCLLYPASKKCDPCGHVICINCLEESTSMCTICGDGTVIGKDVDFIPTMGYRVLTLDGGGVLGKGECIALEHIFSQLYNIPIDQLFDLAVGTSTGGIVAMGIAATDKTPTQIKNEYDNMAKSAFEKTTAFKYFSFASFLVSSFCRYKREPFENCLKQQFSEDKKLASINKIKVSVTSVQLEKNKPCLFSSYHRIENNIRLIPDKLVIDGLFATTPAPSYFLPYQIENERFVDGGLLNNNPCKIAINEAKSIWGDSKKLDLIASLGCGDFKHLDKSDSSPSHKLKNLGNELINIITNCDTLWDEMINNYNQIKLNVNAFRYNPKFSKIIELDAVNELDFIEKEATQYLHSGNTLDPLCNKLLSSLFYVKGLSFSKDNENCLTGQIHCRLNHDSIPDGILKQLQKTTDTVFYEPNSDLIIIDTFKRFPINFKIFSPPLNIDIKCKIVCKNNKLNDTSNSGSPFEFEKFLKN